MKGINLSPTQLAERLNAMHGTILWEERYYLGLWQVPRKITQGIPDEFSDKELDEPETPDDVWESGIESEEE